MTKDLGDFIEYLESENIEIEKLSYDKFKEKLKHWSEKQ